MIIAAKVAPNENELKQVENLYRAVELYTNRNLLKNADIAKKFDYMYVVHAPTDFFDESVIEFAQKVNAETIVTHDVAQNLPELVEKAASLGITTCIELGGQYKVESIDDFMEKKRTAPEIKMCVDVEHAVKLNLFPEIFKLGKDIAHIHLTGSPPGMHTPPMNNPPLIKKAIRELKKINYSEIITLEMDIEYQKPEIFKQAKTFMDKLMTAHN